MILAAGVDGNSNVEEGTTVISIVNEISTKLHDERGYHFGQTTCNRYLYKKIYTVLFDNGIANLINQGMLY